jgi:hypothetical protein
MKRFRLPVLAAAALFGLAPMARPQDSHYWTNQYGTRATLLGGAVIGSVLDLSATYYNPGGLSLIDKPGTLIAAKIMQYPRVNLVGGGPESVSLRAFTPGPAPTLLAGTIRFRGLRNHKFAFSYLARQDAKLGVSISETGLRDVAPGAPGEEDFVTQFRLDQKVAEHWFGLTWSYKASKHIGLGVTQYLAVRSHWSTIQESIETRTQANHIAMAFGSRQYSYMHFRTLWKIGLAADFKEITLGLTLTTPSLDIGGQGTTGMNATLAGLDTDGDGVPDDYLAADYTDGLDSYFQTPFSIAAGMTFKIQKIRVYWSTEWFAAIKPYTVVDAEEFPAQSTGEMLSTDLTHELAPVLNFGVGLEWFYSSRFKGYGSFTTDYSAKKAATETNLGMTDWDIFHIVTGGELRLNKSSLTLGLGYSFGSRELGQRPDLIPPDGIDGLWDPFGGLKFRYAIYKMIIGFAF